MTRSRDEQAQCELAEQYQSLCREQDALPDLADFLESAQVRDLRARADVILVDQAERIARGCLRPVEEYFAFYPDIAKNQSLCLELAAAEFHQRTGRGESISPEIFLARFPEIRTHMERIISPASLQEIDSEETLHVSRESILSGAGETTVDDSLHEEAIDETLKVSQESIFGQKPIGKNDAAEKGVRTTEEWEPDERTIDPAQNSGDSNATLQLDADSLNQISEQFDPGETTGRDQKAASRANETKIPDTLFAEGAAYDHSRQLGEFGGYDLLGEIARGGMGVVFKARQRKLKRIVALKMILAGRLADADDVRRFYAEAEAAAGLDHPNIVPIYEVGQYRGQHFFSMGYVEGQSLAELIAEHPLSAPDAAQMIKTIAEAVDYAHRHGVIHRDLKPANVLLDAEGQPRITDFGLAKRTEADANLTTTGQLMGTPSYMSPEQIKGDSSQVGPPSDVFALGAVLYCLLTGRPPFQAPTVLELLKQVQDSEPVSPKRLTANLPVDLETICLKCLAKEPHRRYESAQALADDLDRFLRGVPVLARPVGTAERVWRWCKRYPAVAGLMAAFALSLILGAGFSTYYAIAAGRRAEEALKQFDRAETNFERAERNFKKAQKAVDQFFVQVSENTLLNQPGMQPLQQKLLSQALEYYQEFLKERGDDPELQDELAATHFRVGIITEIVESPQAAIPSLETACLRLRKLSESKPDDRELQHRLGDALTALGRVHYRTNGHLRAETIFEDAAAVREKLARATPENHEARRELANAYMNQGLVELGRAQSAAGQEEKLAALEQAVGSYTKAQKLRRDILSTGGLSQETLRKVHRDLGQGGYNLGRVHLQMGHAEAGLDNYREAAAEFEKSLKIDPEDQQSTLQLAICYHELAVEATDLSEAWESCELALSHLLPLVRANPRIADYRKELASLYRDRGDIARGLQKLAEAKQAFEESWRLALELRHENHKSAKLLLIALGDFRNLLELSLAGQAEFSGELAFEKLSEMTEELVVRLGTKNVSRRMLGEFAVEFFQLGNLLERQGRLELAVKLSQQGVLLTEQLIGEDRANLDHRFNLHIGLDLLGRLLAENRQHAEARQVYQDRLKVLDELSERLKKSAIDPVELAKLTFAKAQSNNALARLSLIQNEPSQALGELNAAKRLIASLISKFPEHRAVFEQELNETQRMLAELSLPPAIAEKPRNLSNDDAP